MLNSCCLNFQRTYAKRLTQNDSYITWGDMNKKPENMGDRELQLQVMKYERELKWLSKRLSVYRKEKKKRCL